MNEPITMPALSDTMNEGRLVKWVKKIGDAIKKGDSIAEIETDKAVMEVEAFRDGYLAGPLAPEGSEMRVGATIGFLVDSPGAAEAAPSAAASPPERRASAVIPSSPVSEQPNAPSPAPVIPAPPAAAARVRASPYARRLAQQLGVDVAKINGGRGDVHAAAIQGAAVLPPYHLERASSVREAVARNMTESVSIPTFRVTARLPFAPLIAVSKDSKRSLTLLLARACALTVKTYSLFNAIYTAEGFAVRERVDVGIAVDTPDGLIAPVLRDVAARSLSELADDWRGLQQKIASRRLSPEDYQGATFYLSNLGTFPIVQSFDAVLPTGAAAILCVAAADGERTTVTLVCDHRVLAGADAARFLQTLAEFLTSPRKLIE